MPRLSPYTADFALAAVLADETRKATQAQLLHLVTLILPAPEPPLHLVDSNFNVIYDGIEYVRFPLQWNPADMNSDGSVSKSSITIANVARELMYYVEQYNGLKMCRVLIKTVYENVLDEVYTPQADGTILSTPNPKKNNTAYIEDEFYIDTYSATEQTIVFQLEPIIDLEIRLPRRRFMQDSCYWVYGDSTTCRANTTTYPTPCGKTLSDCKARNNEANFGGFPGISGTRRILL